MNRPPKEAKNNSENEYDKDSAENLKKKMTVGQSRSNTEEYPSAQCVVIQDLD